MRVRASPPPRPECPKGARLVNITGRGKVLAGYAIVDEGDWGAVGHLRWHNKLGYAARAERNEIGVQVTVFMHRLILGLRAGGPDVDHINGCRSDNRRCNLRPCSEQQNQWNAKTPATNTTGFRGVHRAHGGRWSADIAGPGGTISLGSYASKELAFAAYCGASRALHGDFSFVGRMQDACGEGVA